MARISGDGDPLTCSFCGKKQKQVPRLIAGPTGVCICGECVELCNELIEEELDESARAGMAELPKPREIYELRTKEEREKESAFADVMPQDLLKFGLIPEFVGRLPVVATVAPLDRTALIRILTEPRNALIKQYQKLFEFDGVELEFTEDAIGAIADQALLRGTGARATRAIIEEVLLNVMYEVPSRDDVAKIVVNRATVLDNVNPTLVPREQSTHNREGRKKSA